jgi:LAS superfamily LD-carboxypeptidase LdcB
MTEQTGVTRRELRLAERAESRAVRLHAWGTHLAPLSRSGLPHVLAGLRHVLTGLPHVLAGLRRLLPGLLRVLSGLRLRLSGLRRPRVDWSAHLAQLSRLTTRPEVVLVVCAAFLAGGVTQGQIEQGQRQEHRELVAAAEQAHLDHVGRVTGALEARLTGQATVFAADKRNEALELARTAVETADTVVQTAAPVVAAETISPLDSAKAQLAGLIATAPDPLDVLPRPVEPPVSTGPQHDGVADPSVTGAVGTSALASATSAGSPLDAPAASGATQGGAESSAKTVAASTGPTDARPSSVARGATASRVPASAAALREPSTAGASIPQAPPTTTPSTPLDALDVGTSLRMIAAAEEVIALSAQVQATAEATIAAAEAAARAAAEAAAAAAAAQAAAEEEARRVAAVADAANGALPRDLLCGVSFARGVELRCDAADAIEDLNVAFRGRFGRDLRVVSSYRDYAEQVATKQAKGSLAGAPGTSNHGLGLAVDLDGFGALGQFDLPTYRWMREHAGDYGWHHPSYMQPGGAGPAEPWHWEFGTED